MGDGFANMVSDNQDVAVATVDSKRNRLWHCTICILGAFLAFSSCLPPPPEDLDTDASSQTTNTTDGSTDTANIPLSASELSAAVSQIRSSADFADSVDPFTREVEWYGVQHAEEIWVVGEFESPWNHFFVRDASIVNDEVCAYLDYACRPDVEWVKSAANAQWGMVTYYTRLPATVATSLVQNANDVDFDLQDVTVLDEYGELVLDDPMDQLWRFAFYTEATDGTRAVLVVDGIGQEGANEGNYISGYGFGNAAKSHWDIPLNYVDWAEDVANQKGWTNVTNLP